MFFAQFCIISILKNVWNQCLIHILKAGTTQLGLSSLFLLIEGGLIFDHLPWFSAQKAQYSIVWPTKMLHTNKDDPLLKNNIEKEYISA